MESKDFLDLNPRKEYELDGAFLIWVAKCCISLEYIKFWEKKLSYIWHQRNTPNFGETFANVAQIAHGFPWQSTLALSYVLFSQPLIILTVFLIPKQVFKRNYRSCHGKVPKNCKTFQEIANELKSKYQSVSETNRAQQDIRSTFKRKPKFGWKKHTNGAVSDVKWHPLQRSEGVQATAMLNIFSNSLRVKGNTPPQPSGSKLAQMLNLSKHFPVIINEYCYTSCCQSHFIERNPGSFSLLKQGPLILRPLNVSLVGFSGAVNLRFQFFL